MFDARRFKATMVLRGKTMDDVANMLGISRVTLYRKLNGNSEFLRREIAACCEFLQIEDPVRVFFANESFLNATKNYQRR